MAEWMISGDLDDEAAYALLAQDRIWNGYSIADLAPPFRQHAQVWAAARRGEPAAAATLLMRHPAFAALIPCGEPEGVEMLLEAQDLPTDVFALARPEHLPALARHYELPPGDHAMFRMMVDRATFQPAPPAPGADRLPEPLGEADLPALVDLYSSYGENMFNPDQLRGGVFFGIREGGGLAAAGGTHVLAERYGMAAVGNIYTAPAARGRGHGLAVTSAVVGALLDRGFDDVILNVATANLPAISVYQRLGFLIHCEYWEAPLRRA